MLEEEWKFEETNLKIKSDSEKGIKSSIKASLKARQKIERLIIDNPEFRTSLEPVSLKQNSLPKIIRLMQKASKIVGIGPFAAVAGSISQVAAEAGKKSGANEIIVDNGGDITIIGNQEYHVGIYAGDSEVSGRFALSIKPNDLPIGICTSSNSVGHSINFGEADAVVIVAEETSIADAAATKIANQVKGNDIELSIKNGLEKAEGTQKVRGCLIARNEQIGVTGKLPEIINLKSRKEKRDQVTQVKT
ncbi:MAG: UPF0280 family protein [Hadesarchaea archaeon]|nr:UPF0280 family protein [Hadesarchaea archaeon]